jgi:branched-subunit amino acid transport protein
MSEMNLIFILIIIYVISVFVNRKLNMYLFKKFNYDVYIGLWFAHIPVTVLFLLIIFEENMKLDRFISNWFRGENCKINKK